ncbi:MAG TPA: NAD(P)(+) transhydrogenase (Re/Si-specific) subunit alpha, partial [Actinotalea caeni]|nr:NAD(P)(+) transhydrogenase (Re/Si-specific) subunit alpha [Actinotalea caeni]
MSTLVALREPDGETRAALTPEAVRTIVRLGHRVVVQTGIGTHAFHPDEAYADAGAEVLEGAPLADALRGADLLA